MKTIETSVQPCRNIRVRRRKYGDRISLVNYNRFYLLDDLSDNVWSLFDGKNSIAEISVMLNNTRNMSLGEALSAVVSLYIHFSENGLLQSTDLKTNEA